MPIDPNIASELIGAGSSVVNSAVNGAINYALQKQQMKWNEQMMDKQNAWSLNMWNKTNAYNTPAMQKERMLDAGMNPLYYGLDGSSANGLESAQALGYQQANVNFENPLQGALLKAQIENVQANTNKTNSERTAIDSKLPYDIQALQTSIRKSGLEANAQEIINKYIEQQQEAELAVKNSTVEVNNSIVQKAGAEIQKMNLEQTSIMIGWLKTREEILNLQKQRDLTDKQIEQLSSLINKSNLEAKKIGLDIQNYDKITVIGTASQAIHIGPFSISAGQPITLEMIKLAELHQKELQAEESKRLNKSSLTDKEKAQIAELTRSGQ